MAKIQRFPQFAIINRHPRRPRKSLLSCGQKLSSCGAIALKKFIENYGVHALIGLFATLTIALFWPGILREDSIAQYQQALNGAYIDHHPPIMAAYWRLLSHIHPGPGLLFFSHMACLWLSAILMTHAYKSTPYRWFFAFIPLIPQVLGYSLFVLKDAGFALTFLLVSSLLILAGRQHRSLRWFELLIISALLFYGAAVKYQAIFVLPFMCIWIAVLSLPKIKPLMRVLAGCAFYGAFFFGITAFNDATTAQKSHSWQFVKLYDLAAISLDQNKPLFPDFVQQGPQFSMEAVRANFNPRRVDEYVFIPEPILIKGKDETERSILWDYWWDTIWTYPQSYLHHRLRLIGFMLTNSPIKTPEEIKSAHATIPGFLMSLLEIVERSGLAEFIKLITSFLLFAPLMVFYAFYGARHLRTPQGNEALSLLMLNLMGLTLIGVLTIFSMASDVRYIYFAMCCCHFSHPVFWHLWRTKK